MSTTDSLSFAPDQAVRGNGLTVATAGTTKTSLSTTEAVSHLLSGSSWSRTLGTAATVSYAFRRTGTVPEDSSSGFGMFNAAQIVQAEKALSAWADVANIRFTRVADADGYSDNATILFGNFSSGPGAGFTVYPGPSSFYTRATSAAGDVWINGSLSYNQAPTTGNYGGNVLVHEIGHALGLGHPSDYDVDTSPTYAGDADYFEDSGQYTVMSYFEESYTGASYGRSTFAAAPQLDDIAAAQRLYGANMSTRTGDTVYGFNSNAGQEWFAASSAGTRLVMAVWDAGGTDTFDFSGFSQAQRIDLRQGAFSNVGGLTGNVAVAYGATIENAVGGSGSDTIIGNASGNALSGNAGADALYGEGGNDTLRGGDGNDTLDGGSGTNVIDGGGGSDTLILAGGLGDYGSVQNGDGSWAITGLGVTDIVTGIESVSLRQAGSGAVNGTYSFTTFTGQTLRAPVLSAHYAAATDFIGDRTSDILWRNTNGDLTTWRSTGSNGNQFVRGADYIGVDVAWKVSKIFDLNGDGRSDILWRNDGGALTVWTGNASGGFSGTQVDSSVGNDWSIATAGDVNGDGRDDVIWRSVRGEVSVWQSNGSWLNGAYYHAPVGNDWRIVGAGDLNGDGRDDLVWRSARGEVVTWQANAGGGFTEGAFFDASVGNDWHIQGIADFDGDGRDDLFWHSDRGEVVLWLARSNGFDRGSFYDASVGLDWKFAEIADFNGDGRADILWRQDSGALSLWLASGNGFNKSVFYDASVSTAYGWSIVGHDYPL